MGDIDLVDRAAFATISYNDQSDSGKTILVEDYFYQRINPFASFIEPDMLPHLRAP